ncbi:hypothetical protein [Actinocorallia longicatena]
MAASSSRVAWIIAILFGAVVLIVGIVFIYIGIDNSDKLGSAIACLATLIGLGITVYSSFQARNIANPSRQRGGQASNIRQTQSGGDNSSNIQSAGDVSFGDNNQI